VHDHVEQSSNLENLTLDEIEKRAITEALKRTHGSLIEASELLGIHRNTLRLKIQKYQISL
jgi:DNA-binding protein Fis